MTTKRNGNEQTKKTLQREREKKHGIKMQLNKTRLKLLEYYLNVLSCKLLGK